MYKVLEAYFVGKLMFDEAEIFRRVLRAFLSRHNENANGGRGRGQNGRGRGHNGRGRGHNGRGRGHNGRGRGHNGRGRGHNGQGRGHGQALGESSRGGNNRAAISQGRSSHGARAQHERQHRRERFPSLNEQLAQLHHQIEAREIRIRTLEEVQRRQQNLVNLEKPQNNAGRRRSL
ncbi:hypothetical protein PVAND_009724 [Polypedilum vanderplanki]|uniref:Uncharacterized protein n=1 Tax=Polypedilum vanderplanki TaxID=319348 RepID=A0A9J6CE31_POLVA|nr:hypothetical protein PVAND_009724 [Polypedilum vanderplanki]